MANIEKKQKVTEGVKGNSAQNILRIKNNKRKCWIDDCDLHKYPVGKKPQTIFEFFGFGLCCSSRDGDNDDDNDNDD